MLSIGSSVHYVNVCRNVLFLKRLCYTFIGIKAKYMRAYIISGSILHYIDNFIIFKMLFISFILSLYSVSLQ